MKQTNVAHKDPLQMSLARLRANRVAMASLWVLIVFYGAAVFAGFLAPYHFDDEARAYSHHPPTRIHFTDEEGRPTWPFVRPTRSGFDEFYRRVFEEDASVRCPLRFFVRGDAYRILGVLQSDLHLVGVDAPGRLYLLGADARGRDLWSRLLFGAQFSLSIGLVGVLISFSLGLLIGGISGYFGGLIDDATMRISEMFMMIPGFYLLLALRASFPQEMSSVQVYLLIVVIMSFIGWPGLARVIRGMVISLREREYVVAAQASGRSALGIITGHLLPNTFSYAIVAATLSIPGYILGESALSLLGLGIQDPYASWGTLLSDAMGIAEIRFHPWSLWPGVCIFVVVMAFNFLGDGLRDAFDPKL